MNIKMTEKGIRDLFSSDIKIVWHYITSLGRREIRSSHEYLGMGADEYYEIVAAYYGAHSDSQ